MSFENIRAHLKHDLTTYWKDDNSIELVCVDKHCKGGYVITIRNKPERQKIREVASVAP